MSAMDQLKLMRLFVAIADEGSLTGAAEALGTSQPSVVRGLARLEAHLGVRLFHRSTRRIALTDEGRRYLADSRQILGALAEADAGMRAELSDPTGLLRITAPVQFGQMYVAPMLNRLVAHHPKLQAELILFDRVVNLVEEGFDAAIRIGALEDSSLVARTLGVVRRVVVASPGYLARHGRPSHPGELRDADCVGFSSASGPNWRFRDGGRQLKVTIDSRVTFNLVAPGIAACRDGLGFGSFLSYQVAPDVADGALEIVLADFEPPPLPISVITPHARLLPARTRLFIDTMREALAGFAM
ncbi:LysR family transcriptional regulator [Denitromonas sp.]|uniref:LysR family transcriptional regulator n=1 Tax=Denitromonas sp. TaxID=2734609 RepID=UPI002AFEEFE4|nr:LysR family transcriptional regulator [Denitromonas sp.]